MGGGGSNTAPGLTGGNTLGSTSGQNIPADTSMVHTYTPQRQSQRMMAQVGDGSSEYYGGAGAPVDTSSPTYGIFGGGMYPAAQPAQPVNQAPVDPQTLYQGPIDPRYTNMVNNAYAQIGKSGVGTGSNQIDQAGFNYWQNQLQSGAIKPSDFANSFSASAKAVDPTIYRPRGPEQFYQPIYQSQYQNYANPATANNVSQYGQPQMPAGGVGPMPAANGNFSMGSAFNPYLNMNQQQIQQQMYQSPQFQMSQFPQPQYPASQSQQQTPIYSRSSQRTGSPNVRRYAEGGLASLVTRK